MHRVALLLTSTALVVFGQQTINVPANYPTIQAAVNAAQNGDTILVAPGDHLGPIAIINKVLNLSSSGGPGAAILKFGASSTTTTLLHIAGSAGVLIDGFTIDPSTAYGITPLVCDDSSAVFSNCSFTAATARCLVQNLSNQGPVRAVTFSACAFQYNFPASGTAVLDVLSGFSHSVLIDGCQFVSNFCVGGAAFRSLGYGITVRGCLFSDNVVDVALQWGTNSGGVATISRCRVIGNSGVGIAASDVTPTGCLIANNGSTGSRSGVIQSTVTGNGLGYTALFGSPIYSGALYGTNSVIAGNVGFDHLGSATKCVLEPGVPMTPLAAATCVAADPLFINPANGDFRLAPNSPGKDFGAPGITVDLLDLALMPRVVGAGIDAGAFEIQLPLMPGTNEDLALFGWIDDSGDSQSQVLAPSPGQLATFLFKSPAGAFAGTYPLLAAQLFPDAMPPLAPPIPGLWLDANAVILYGGIPTAPFYLGLPPGGFSGAWSVPPGLQGLRVRMQGFASTPFAANGLFASTNALELDF